VTKLQLSAELVNTTDYNYQTQFYSDNFWPSFFQCRHCSVFTMSLVALSRSISRCCCYCCCFLSVACLSSAMMQLLPPQQLQITLSCVYERTTDEIDVRMEFRCVSRVKLFAVYVTSFSSEW